MIVTRQARRDLSGISKARAKEVLDLARVPIDAEISRLKVALSRCSAIDADDLRSLGQIAALEASLTHNAEKGTLRTWIGTVVRWRLGEAMKDAGDLATVEVARGLTSDFEGLGPSYDPSESYELADAKAWVERSLAGLTPRQKILVAQLLGNSCDTFQELSMSFGIDRTWLTKSLGMAITMLQERMEKPKRVRQAELLAKLEGGEVRQCA